MKAVLVSVVALFMSLALLVSGSAMLGTLVALRLDMEGMPKLLLGVVMAFYSTGFVLGAIYGVGVIRKVGHIRAFAVFAALACATTLAHPLLVSAPAWAVMRLVVGFCLAGLMTVTESWINDRATNDSRGKLLGVYTINFYMASAVGQILVGFGNPMEFVAYTVVAMLIVLSLVPLSLTQSLIPTPPSSNESMGWRRLARQAPAGTTGALASGIALGAFGALAPVYALQAGRDVSEVAWYMAFSVFCAVLLQWPAGWLSDRWGRLPVLTALLFTGALAAIGTALLGTTSVIALFGLSGALYALATGMYPVSVALANDQLPNDQLVAACAGMLRTYGVGTMIGPLLGAALMGVFGDPALFVFIGLSLLLAGVAVQYLFRVSDAVPLEEQGEYVTLGPISTPVLMELDPRNEEFEEHHPGEPAEWDLADKLEMMVIDPEQIEPLPDDTPTEPDLEQKGGGVGSPPPPPRPGPYAYSLFR